MTDRFAVSPFGGRGLARAQFALNEQIMRSRKAAAGQDDSARADAVADKWKLIRAVTEAKAALGLSDRTIAVLEALMSFYPERQLDLRRPLIVFPSNAELSLRTRGMAPATLRRHLACLVEARMMLRRDSANGKRFACRNDKGEVEAAFGFDLAPLVMRAGEIERLAGQAREEAKAIRMLRAEITIHLRDIAAILKAAGQEGRAAGDLIADFEALSGRLGRNTPRAELTRRRDALVSLRARLEAEFLAESPVQAVETSSNVPETSPESPKMSANDAQNERHIEGSESEYSLVDKQLDFEKHDRNVSASSRKVDSCQPPRPSRPVEPIELTLVLSACPQIRDYAPHGIAGWRDLAAAADLVRSMLGISGSAWEKARQVLGQAAAAAAVAAILERIDQIKSPGGYLRGLTARAEMGDFSLKPMLSVLAARGLRDRLGSGQAA
ncbi:plasmid replication protein RepC [Nitratireductor luteus]|uniref:plasmid replication protein RepC n=1 Tax=Nitratireductor luteus TaxID=2976980 RepID=UPI00223F0195|nr:plasmid replication protein RepC [Nitratireductor luteus]